MLFSGLGLLDKATLLKFEKMSNTGSFKCFESNRLNINKNAAVTVNNNQGWVLHLCSVPGRVQQT